MARDRVDRAFLGKPTAINWRSRRTATMNIVYGFSGIFYGFSGICFPSGCASGIPCCAPKTPTRGPDQAGMSAAVDEARSALNAHYIEELGEPFVSVGLCLYRDGSDSVAWHGDRIARESPCDTMVAILSLGAVRPFALRPKSGGPGLRLQVGHGDLLVIGGSCQRTWLHAIPKSKSRHASIPVTTGDSPPRTSVEWPRSVRIRSRL